jgi:hypothetical protein
MGFVPTFPEDNVVAKIDEAERHVPPAPVGGDGAVEREPERATAPVALAEPPVERAAEPEPTADESGDGAAESPQDERARRRAERKAQRMKQSKRRRKHGRAR